MTTGYGCDGEKTRRRIWAHVVGGRARLIRASVACLLIVLAASTLCLVQTGQGSTVAVESNACDMRQKAAVSDADTGHEGYVAVISAWGDTCHAVFDWPLRKPVSVLKAYDGPAQPWLSGHRGVDLQTRTGEEILAPGDGMVSFTGKVAGKDVVSIKYGDMALTFEPAITDIGVGASVRRGQPFAKVGESSDHCDNVCLHWGIRSGEKTYLDPASMVSAYRIVLKPKAE